jgi:hypothetical protein
MPEKRIEKPAEEEGKKLPLITNEKFAKFLVKEFPEEFERQPGKARETAFRYPQDKKEVMVLLREWMPKASFKGIDGLLKSISCDTISKNLRILEEHSIPPSVWRLHMGSPSLEENIKTLEENKIQFRILLEANSAYLKANIQALKDRGRNLAEYARLSYLGEEPKKFNELLDREEAIMKTLEENLPNMSPDAIRELVNKNELRVLDRIVRYVERQERKLEELTDSNIQVLVLSTEKLGLGLPPEKPDLKLLVGGPYCLADREGFEYLINKRFKGRRKGARVGLHEPEREAFKEMEGIIDKEGKINGDEIQVIYNKHMGYSYVARSRLDEIVSWLTEHGGWKKWEETERKEQPAGKEQ